MDAEISKVKMKKAVLLSLALAIAAMVLVAEGAFAQSPREQAQAWLDKGLAMGNNSAAEAECYRKAIGVDPTYAAAYFNLGYVLQAQGKLDEARDAFRSCLKQDPGRVDAYLNLGTILSVPGPTQDLEGAREALYRYLERKPDASNAASVKADIQVIEERIAALKKAVVPEQYTAAEVAARLSSSFRRGSSPYAGPRLPVRIQFAFDSDQVLPESEPQLAALAAALQEERLRGVTILIEGHTDGKGTLEYNEGLSQRRAESVKRYLAAHHGIDPSRLRVEGKGKRQPIQPNDSEEHMATNRRVEFVRWNALEQVREDVQEHPTRSASEWDQFFKVEGEK